MFQDIFFELTQSQIQIVFGSSSRSAAVSFCACWGSWQGEGPWLWLVALGTCNRWLPKHDTWHVTCDMWHMTPNTWHLIINVFYMCVFLVLLLYPHILRDSVCSLCGNCIFFFSSSFLKTNFCLCKFTIVFYVCRKWKFISRSKMQWIFLLSLKKIWPAVRASF